MANLCCATEEMITRNHQLYGFRPYSGKLSREDVATLVEVFELALNEGYMGKILEVLKNPEGFFLFRVSEEESDFDFYSYLNSNFIGGAVISPINAKMMFPRSISRGVYSKYSQQIEVYEEDDEDDPPTGYMDLSEMGSLQQPKYYLLFNRLNDEINFPDNGEKVLGRSNKLADYVIRGSGNVSRKHCRIYVQGGKPYVKDESANGTFINEKRVTPQQGTELHVDDVLRLADEEFIVKSR